MLQIILATALEKGDGKNPCPFRRGFFVSFLLNINILGLNFVGFSLSSQ